MAPKPGVIALRPLGVGEILDGSFAAMRSNPAATLGITLAIAAIIETISIVMTIAAEDSTATTALVFNLVAIFLNALLGIFLSGVLSVVVSEATLGQKISPGDAVRRIASRLPGLVGLSVAVLLLTLLPFIIIIPLALLGGESAALAGILLLTPVVIYIAIALVLATPAYVLEGGTLGHAVRRSVDLVKGAWWRTFGILLLTVIVAVLLTLIFVVPTLIVISTSPSTFGDVATGYLTTAGHIVTALGDLLATTISTPVLAGAVVLTYVDRRIRREGLDVTLAEAARQRAGRLEP